ncbi:MAG: hypothetical protein QNJ74_11040 [Trichodesmium sp. MO_231.B1]|nr:hypothetical protein [Trichodesmium sp. MO_231.B1]
MVLGWVGLASCLFLAFWVELQICLVGLELIIVGLMWHNLVHRLITELKMTRIDLSVSSKRLGNTRL